EIGLAARVLIDNIGMAERATEGGSKQHGRMPPARFPVERRLPTPFFATQSIRSPVERNVRPLIWKYTVREIFARNPLDATGERPLHLHELLHRPPGVFKRNE